jgi:hypothetical protein
MEIAVRRTKRGEESLPGHVCHDSVRFAKTAASLFCEAGHEEVFVKPGEANHCFRSQKSSALPLWSLALRFASVVT